MTVTAPTSNNGSSPSNTSSTSSSQSQIGLTSNQFLSLLTTQLQNQNPLNPTDPDKFTSEMVQYASLSQQIDTNTSLTSMNTALSSILTQVSLLTSAHGANQSQSSQSSS
jgi:flagellar basal-body rod modification protein FlgD